MTLTRTAMMILVKSIRSKPIPEIVEGWNSPHEAPKLPPTSNYSKGRLKTFKEYPNTQMVIHGYTDNTGKRSTNRRLSRRCAEAVKQYFVDRGVCHEFGTGQSHRLKRNARRTAKESSDWVRNQFSRQTLKRLMLELCNQVSVLFFVSQ
ncbi:OmpA family protein [candidate division KSB1 bacterium]|nr:OmpA family protein [candidate division KSB1 bacterium]NIU93467.1 OmpA family protein [candidate division KSB1 bacterium]NIW19595.1 OmpA family protein [candidate division KSB1 bacterium]